MTDPTALMAGSPADVRGYLVERTAQQGHGEGDSYKALQTVIAQSDGGAWSSRHASTTTPGVRRIPVDKPRSRCHRRLSSSAFLEVTCLGEDPSSRVGCRTHVLSPENRCGRGKFGTKRPVPQRSTATTPTPVEPASHQLRRAAPQRHQTPLQPRVCKRAANGRDRQRAARLV